MVCRRVSFSFFHRASVTMPRLFVDFCWHVMFLVVFVGFCWHFVGILLAYVGMVWHDLAYILHALYTC